MRFSKFLGRRARYNIAALGFLVALAIPSLVPALASAAELTDRSITLSSTSANASDVTYKVAFTAASDATAFVVDFCTNSPIVGDTCDAPASPFSASGASSATTDFTDVTGSASQFVVADSGTFHNGDNISVEVDGIHNPSTSGPLYARIVTYDTKTDALAYTSTDLGSGATDNGGVAMSITDSIGVSGTVLETMTFCVSAAAVGKDCAGPAPTAPTLKLGETVGDVIALEPGVLSTGSLYTQISTNAVSGAVVNLKSDTTGCGGLVRAGAPGSCDIGPALTGGITAGQAKFGVETATATSTSGDSDATGTYEPVSASGYGNSAYALNYASGDATGVTSPYGDPFLDTAGAPVNNKNMTLTFGASISNSTPAGNYSADLSLIATGKF